MISVLVPAYNVEAYLKRCLDSILAQTFQDYEVVIVDDGSTDASGKIAENYASKYKNFRVIHQNNSGLAQTRNVLVAAATGEYITFVDSDDAIEPEYLQTLWTDLQDTGSDIAICSWCEIHGREDRHNLSWIDEKKGLQVWDGDAAVKNLLYQKEIDNNCWGKLYHRRCFCEVVFPSGKTYEDIAVAFRLFTHAKRVCYRPEPLYLYTINTSGISQSAFSMRRMDAVDMAEKMYAEVKEEFPRYQIPAAARLVRLYMHIYLQIPDTREFRDCRYRVERGIRTHCRSVLMDREAKRGTRIACAICCVSPRLLKRLRSFQKMAK